MIPAKDLAPATPFPRQAEDTHPGSRFRGLVWPAGGSSTGFSLPPPPLRGHWLVSAPELPAQLSPGGQCGRACGRQALLGALI